MVRAVAARVPASSPHLFASAAFAQTARLTVIDPPVWVAISSRGGLTANDIASLDTATARVGLRLDPITTARSGLTTPWWLAPAIVGVFSLLCAVAVLLAAAERSHERRLLCAAGVGPRGEGVAEALATAGLLAAGSLTLTAVFLAATALDVGALVDVAGRMQLTLLFLTALPAAAAILSAVTVAVAMRRGVGTET